MHVKICGITNAVDASEAARCGADFVGLILAPSARRVTVEKARQVMAMLPVGTQPVLLFRDSPLDDVVAALQTTGCPWVQLHGREPVSYLAALALRRPLVHLIKAWEVASPQADEDLARHLKNAVGAGVRIDVLLLDAPKGRAHPGYERLGDLSLRCQVRPPAIWCAGGLTPANLATAVASGRYDGVDVAGGVESRPGVKDHVALRRFVETAKRL